MNERTDDPIAIAARTTSPKLRFAIERLTESVPGATSVHDLGDVSIDDVDVVIGTESALNGRGLNGRVRVPAGLDPEGFRIARVPVDEGTVTIAVAPAAVGAMYGGLEIAERIRSGTNIADVEETTSSPSVSFRAIKFNLPWSPYRGGDQTDVHYDTCRDLDFWRAFLDRMAEDRFNALTLWNLHPFPFMIRPENYPEACPFDDELADWKDYWKSLFRMAHERGIETHILNWNIVVSTEFSRAYDVDERNDRSEVVKEYTPRVRNAGGKRVRAP